MPDHTRNASDVADSLDVMIGAAMVDAQIMRQDKDMHPDSKLPGIYAGLKELSFRLEAVETDTHLHTDIYVAKLHSSESVKRVADALLYLVPTLSKE